MTTVNCQVCGKPVDIATAIYKTVHKGKVIYFCSNQCMEKFEKEPEKYI
ncbi:MAG: YHS domain-containing protein [Candidatus Njordarchaeia archaeon]